MGRNNGWKKLKKARKVLGLRQADVAAKVGITSNYYSMIERGKMENPGAKIVARIAKILKLKLSDIFPFLVR
ncbi:MAG: helix-turn-helix domain-containing protein [Patescibacteria group bacterium]|nr:helix-turn-helix domain-containing protein [Patescibacteria group bacterium]